MTARHGSPQPADALAAVAAALALVARAERSAALDLPPPTGTWVVRGKLAARSPMTASWPGHLPPPPGPRATPVPVSGPPLVADAVLLARLSKERLRARAFYLDAGLTLAVHERSPLRRRSPLLRGAQVLQRLQGHTAYAVPRPVAWGVGPRSEWAVEHVVVGTHIDPAQRQDAVGELAELMVATWAHVGHGRGRTSGYLGGRSLREVERLLVENEPDGCGDPAALRRVLAGRLELTTSLCHGDPVLGNVMRTPDGRLALIDWELARKGPVAADLVRLLVAVPDVDAIVARIDTAAGALGAGFARTWRAQAVVALTRWLGGWRRQQAIAERSRRLPAHERRLRTRCELLLRLLADAEP